MDKEIAEYVFNYFSDFMSEKEVIAWRHYCSTVKLSGKENSTMAKALKKRGFLTEDQTALNLLKDGIDNFQLRAAKRILADNKQKIFFNKCPKCEQLARTPQAKQCRHCGHDWHAKNKNHERQIFP